MTQLRPSEQYIAATRTALLLMAAAPMWVLAASLGLCYRPLHQVAAHLVVLLLLASILTDFSMIGVSKIPFACSYLPGKANVQYRFWAFVVIFFPLAMTFSHYEQDILDRCWPFVRLLAILGAVAVALWAFNRRHARSAVLYYEELPPEVITTLGIGSFHPSPTDTPSLG